jgi:hypothetical protein
MFITSALAIVSAIFVFGIITVTLAVWQWLVAFGCIQNLWWAQYLLLYYWGLLAIGDVH